MSVCAQCALRHGPRSFRALPTIRVPNRTTVPLAIRSFSTSISRPADTPAPKSKPITSSVAAGTTLKGINYIKKLSDPLALPDEEYPPWLWKVLEDRRPQLTSTPQISAEDAADLYGKSKARRRQAQKRIAAKEAAGTSTIAVPADHRTEDMPFETYEESHQAIMEAKKAARARRRAAIKEKNFLGQLG
ncbi:hypothetical protein ABW19_dt0208266 [Dactylella cylindrospora]|nr:hypothetical protein ABW19_dt0208266 [Dactylella cylindrospora]